jgi:hypothetical protein
MYKVSIEIQVEANSPLEAAKKVEEMLTENPLGWQYYVQEEDEKEIYSVDLDEEDEDAVLIAQSYHPLINN